MEGTSKLQPALAKAVAFYWAQGCYWADREELYQSVRPYQLPETLLRSSGNRVPIDKVIFLAKLRIIHRYLWLLALVPFSRMFLLAGSLACGSPRTGSDIDIIVVARSGRVWLNRILIEAATRLVGQRRGRRTQNKFCFNCSLEDAAPILPNQNFTSAQFYKHLLPLWRSEETSVKQFWRANGWIRSYAPLFRRATGELTPIEQRGLIERIRTVFEFGLECTGLAPLGEWLARLIQERYIRQKAELHLASAKTMLCLERSRIYYHFPYSPSIQKQEKVKKILA